MRTLTPEEVIESYSWTPWKKTASTRIKKLLTQTDIEAERETFFFDLEGRKHILSIGRCICVGLEGEKWTCSIASLERDRYPIGDEDEHGYREYKQINPRPLRCFDIPGSFVLSIPGKASWKCEEEMGAFITWDGEHGPHLDMRVIKRTIFEKTYERCL